VFGVLGFGVRGSGSRVSSSGFWGSGSSFRFFGFGVSVLGF
jgi:hypothetical protein